jgi:hypothetical protein
MKKQNKSFSVCAIENIFCQQRYLYHGPTTNPTYNSYRTGINSVILEQFVISRRSNAGGSHVGNLHFLTI